MGIDAVILPPRVDSKNQLTQTNEKNDAVMTEVENKLLQIPGNPSAELYRPRLRKIDENL